MLMSSTRPGPGWPTLFHRMSSPPKAATASRTTRRASVSLVRSHGIPSARPPAFVISSTVSPIRPLSMSATATDAPSRAKSTAAARPIPDAAAVISAILFASRMVRPPPSCLAWPRGRQVADCIARPRIREGSGRARVERGQGHGLGIGAAGARAHDRQRDSRATVELDLRATVLWRARGRDGRDQRVGYPAGGLGAVPALEGVPDPGHVLREAGLGEQPVVAWEE